MQNYSTSQSQALALAAIFQSAYLVDHIAVSGKIEPENYNPLLQSLFTFDSDYPAAIYGGSLGVSLGLGLLTDALTASNKSAYRAVFRYSLSIMHVESKLSRNSEQLNIIANRLQHIQFKSEHFSNDISHISSSVAAVYKDTISTFKSRIHIRGNAIHLQQTGNADKIRTLLLAGIRASVLWRQMGGKRWHLLFSKKRLLNALQSLLEQQ